MEEAAVGPVVVMGVSGSGKSVLGSALAARLGAPYVDGDDLHPAANVAKMAAGTPLTDADRWPWLDRVGEWLRTHRDGVTACSALKRGYRDRLRAAVPGVVFLHMSAPRAVLEARMSHRPGHFMPVGLLGSQLAALEPLQPDEDGVTLDATRPPEDVLAGALAWLRERDDR